MSRAKKMVQDLIQLKNDKAAMVAFKRGISPALAHKSWPYMARYGWCDLNSDKMRTIVQSIAAFFAMNPNHTEGICFGKTLRIMAMKRSTSDPIADNEKYIKRLLACRDYQSLCERLSFVMRLVKNFEVPIDYERLYNDIVYWSEDKKIRWANSYYYNREAENVSDASND